jgi:hypothetical protein
MAQSKADVVILLHRHDLDFDRGNWTIGMLAPVWREMGLAVAVEQGAAWFGGARAPLAVNHVSHTVTPPFYRWYLRRFPSVINGRLTDISKSNYCDLLPPGTAYDGAVIVKTNLNYGGSNEKHSLQRRPIVRRLRAVPDRIRRYVGKPPPFWRGAVYLKPAQYPIYVHPSLVPPEAWSNANLVIQKFQPERDDENLYRLRCWYVFGDRGFHVVLTSNQPVVKGEDIIARSVTTEPTPPELEAVRRAMRVDFGRIDYAIVDGKPVVYDINRTPTSSPQASAAYAAQWRDLALGIESFRR